MNVAVATPDRRVTRAQHIDKAMRAYLIQLARSIELSPGRSYTVPTARLHSHLEVALPGITLDDMERVYLPLMKPTVEYGRIGVTHNPVTRELTFTNLMTVPGPDVLVFRSAIVRLQEDGRQVYVEAFHTQANTDEVTHLSVAEDWSHIFIEAGPLDRAWYNKLEARLASEEEFQHWVATKLNGRSVYHKFV